MKPSNCLYSLIGILLGASQTPGTPIVPSQQTFLWQNGHVTILGTPTGFNNSQGYAINDANQIVGAAYNAGTTQISAFIWQNGSFTTIGTPPGFTGTEPGDAINGSGQFAGRLRNDIGQGFEHAFLYSAGRITDLGTLGGTNSQAIGINSFGDVVGGAQTAAGFQHAFLYHNGVMSDLGTLGGRTSRAFGINDLGQVVGEAEVSPGGAVHAFLWSSSSGMRDLGVLPNEGGSRAIDINNRGQVVGTSGTPFLWQNGTLTALSVFPGFLGDARSINASGTIAGVQIPISDKAPEVAAIWDPNGVRTNIGLEPGFNGPSSASGINDAGVVTGTVTPSVMQSVPEIDPGSATSAVTLLIGGVLLLTSRRARK
jgi:probable HAF family extracellular repeat protein